MDDALHIGVIGATGMLGHHTARAALAAGHTLTVFHRQSSKLDVLGDLQFTAAEVDLIIIVVRPKAVIPVIVSIRPMLSSFFVQPFSFTT